MSWQLSEIMNRSLAKAHIEDARTPLQTSPVWLSGWKSHSLRLAMDVSKVSWVWLRREHHKLASLSSVVFLYFRFHKNHEVKGLGKQNKEHEKENRKGIWRMTSTLGEDLVWFSWQVSSCSLDRRRRLGSFSSAHIPLGKMTSQRYRAEAIRLLRWHLSAHLRSTGRQQWTCFWNQSTWQKKTFNLQWKQICCVPHAFWMGTYKDFSLHFPKVICSVEMQFKSNQEGTPENSLCLCQRCPPQAGHIQ